MKWQDAFMQHPLPELIKAQIHTGIWLDPPSNLTFYVLSFIGKIKNATIHIILPHWHDTGSWIIYSCKTWTYPFCIVNMMGADGLVTQGARASATMLDIDSVEPE